MGSLLQAVLLPALLIAGCSGQGVTAAQGREQDQGPAVRTLASVRLTNQPGTLLLTTCTRQWKRMCSVTLVPGPGTPAVEYVAPAGGSLADATFSGDRVMAVAVRAKPDAQGNRASRIVSFAPGEAVMTVQYHAPVELLHPTEDAGRLLFWRRDCRSPKERYCEYDLYGTLGAGAAELVGQSLRFGEVGPIVPRGRGMIVNADLVGEGLFTPGYQDQRDSNTAWLLAPGQPFGLGKLANGLSTMRAMPLPDDNLLLLAFDKDGTALFRQTASGRERIAGLPPVTDSMEAFAIIDVAPSPDGERIAMIIADPRADFGTGLYMLDVATREWRTVDPSDYRARTRIELNESTHAR